MIARNHNEHSPATPTIFNKKLSSIDPPEQQEVQNDEIASSAWLRRYSKKSEEENKTKQKEVTPIAPYESFFQNDKVRKRGDKMRSNTMISVVNDENVNISKGLDFQSNLNTSNNIQEEKSIDNWLSTVPDYSKDYLIRQSASNKNKKSLYQITPNKIIGDHKIITNPLGISNLNNLSSFSSHRSDASFSDKNSQFVNCNYSRSKYSQHVGMSNNNENSDSISNLNISRQSRSLSQVPFNSCSIKLESQTKNFLESKAFLKYETQALKSSFSLQQPTQNSQIKFLNQQVPTNIPKLYDPTTECSVKNQRSVFQEVQDLATSELPSTFYLEEIFGKNKKHNTNINSNNNNNNTQNEKSSNFQGDNNQLNISQPQPDNQITINKTDLNISQINQQQNVDRWGTEEIQIQQHNSISSLPPFSQNNGSLISCLDKMTTSEFGVQNSNFHFDLNFNGVSQSYSHLSSKLCSPLITHNKFVEKIEHPQQSFVSTTEVDQQNNEIASQCIDYQANNNSNSNNSINWNTNNNIIESGNQIKIVTSIKQGDSSFFNKINQAKTTTSSKQNQQIFYNNNHTPKNPAIMRSYSSFNAPLPSIQKEIIHPKEKENKIMSIQTGCHDLQFNNNNPTFQSITSNIISPTRTQRMKSVNYDKNYSFFEQMPPIVKQQSEINSKDISDQQRFNTISYQSSMPTPADKSYNFLKFNTQISNSSLLSTEQLQFQQLDLPNNNNNDNERSQINETGVNSIYGGTSHNESTMTNNYPFYESKYDVFHMPSEINSPLISYQQQSTTPYHNNTNPFSFQHSNLSNNSNFMASPSFATDEELDKKIKAFTVASFADWSENRKGIELPKTTAFTADIGSYSTTNKQLDSLLNCDLTHSKDVSLSISQPMIKESQSRNCHEQSKENKTPSLKQQTYQSIQNTQKADSQQSIINNTMMTSTPVPVTGLNKGISFIDYKKIVCSSNNQYNANFNNPSQKTGNQQNQTQKFQSTSILTSFLKSQQASNANFKQGEQRPTGNNQQSSNQKGTSNKQQASTSSMKSSKLNISPLMPKQQMQITPKSNTSHNKIGNLIKNATNSNANAKITPTKDCENIQKAMEVIQRQKKLQQELQLSIQQTSLSLQSNTPKTQNGSKSILSQQNKQKIPDFLSKFKDTKSLNSQLSFVQQSQNLKKSNTFVADIAKVQGIFKHQSNKLVDENKKGKEQSQQNSSQKQQQQYQEEQSFSLEQQQQQQQQQWQQEPKQQQLEQEYEKKQDNYLENPAAENEMIAINNKQQYFNLPQPTSDAILFDNFFKKENFRIGKNLGNGKFSEVYMAQDIRNGLIVALKKIKKQVLIKYNSEDYLENEIKIQSVFNHPNILKLFGFYYDADYIYLVQEYACHGELYHELKKQPDQKFDEVKAAAYMRQVVEAFSYMHKLRVIHRDIKPENILVSFGVLKIADFGCSVYCPEDRRDTFCGTIHYISPEIVTGQGYGQSVDIWSLGILAYELLTGKSPFQYETKNEILQNILDVNINIPQTLSEDAQDFIKRVLVKDPRLRMTMDQVQNHKWISKNLKQYSQQSWDNKIAQETMSLVA